MSELQKLETRLTETLSRQATEVAEVQARHVAEVAEVQDQIKVIKNNQLDVILAQASELGFNLRVVGNNAPAKRTTRTPGNRKPATCKICRSAGLSGEKHTARSHDKWLALEPADVLAKFE